MSRCGNEYLNSPEKRALDITGAIVISPFALAAGGIAGVLLAKEVGGPRNGLFNQERVAGSSGVINVSKLRTIHASLTDGLSDVRMGSNDLRAGPIGRAVRRAGVDEIPQLVDVLKGNMSLVGPRPLTELDLEIYESTDGNLFEEWYEVYKSIRAGLFGPSQLMRSRLREGFNREVIKKSMIMDIDYGESASLTGDIKILAGAPATLAMKIN